MTSIFKKLGPGLLYAGAAIGVSHLVQSTRAGAEYGFYLIWVVLLANLLKFPFFQFGPRYAAATGNNLLHGYRQLGQWAVILFVLMTLGTMFVIQSAVTVVTAGLAEQLTGIVLLPWQWSGILLLICLLVLGIGRYQVLDKLMKVIIVTLTITTIIAFISAFFGHVEQSPDLKQHFSWGVAADVFFVITLVGWMPAPLDISVWHSVWSLAGSEEKKKKLNMKDALTDFRVGYWGTAFLAVCFIGLGALVLYGSGETLSPDGAVFAGQLIKVYTQSLGSWAYPVIAVAAFTTMFSTTLTCLDAFPRVLRAATYQLYPSTDDGSKTRSLYWFWILFTASGTMVVLAFFLDNMRSMITMATTISFLTAPVIALMNYLVIYGKGTPVEARPGKLTQWISWVGLVFLFGFSFYYLFIKF